ncbi:hypothetical protein predicted by Glimmer/Critica [Salmonella enterica subsp. enterica serovar Weltevreden str. 2007-60-3289-1]|nr:hypothetical protein predicted by Glimmer/Critica [Salmonella enterica subsp. enterica serovar Weltevreden str. 2007-60-3289-1]
MCLDALSLAICCKGAMLLALFFLVFPSVSR